MSSKAPLAKRLAWPRLSRTLKFERHPNICQRCGAEHDITCGIASRVWQECDEWDRPEKVFLIVCQECEKSGFIDRHPRLYQPVAHNAPLPGVMHLCVDCAWRDGLTCRHPDLKVNGGNGMEITCSKPLVYHLKAERRKDSGFYQSFDAPPSRCAGREEAYCVTEEEGPAVFPVPEREAA